MDRWKFFDVAHRDHLFCNPLDAAKVDEMLGLLLLGEGSTAVDIACGKAETTLRLAEMYPVRVTGVDLSPYCERDAREKARGRRLRGEAAFVLGDGAAYPVAPASLDPALCVGASWVFGGHRGTLAALAAMVRSGGLVLVGEPFWRREPTRACLEATGTAADAFASHAGNVRSGLEAGLALLYTVVSSEDDWDRYEGLQWQAVERYAADRPDDPDLPEILAEARRRRDAYLEAGRDCLGWALYLFRRP